MRLSTVVSIINAVLIVLCLKPLIDVQMGGDWRGVLVYEDLVPRNGINIEYKEVKIVDDDLHLVLVIRNSMRSTIIVGPALLHILVDNEEHVLEMREEVLKPLSESTIELVIRQGKEMINYLTTHPEAKIFITGLVPVKIIPRGISLSIKVEVRG